MASPEPRKRRVVAIVLATLGVVGVLGSLSSVDRTWTNYSRDRQRLERLTAEAEHAVGQRAERVRAEREVYVPYVAEYRRAFFAALGLLGVSWLVAGVGGVWLLSMLRSAPPKAMGQGEGGRSPQIGGTWELLAMPVAMSTFSLLLWATQPTQRDLIRANGPALAGRRQQVLRIAAALDPRPVRANRCVARLDPLPTSAAKDSLVTNTALLSSSDFERLQGDLVWQDQLDLMLDNGFLSLGTLMIWQHEQTVLRRKVGKKEAALVRAALADRYLVLHRVTVTQSLARDSNGSAQGEVAVEAALFALDSGARLCELAFVEHIEPDFRMEDEFERRARSRLRTQTRQRLMKELSTVTGGSFSL